jgi:hypothetical protein
MISKQKAKSTGCLSLLIGGLFSILMPAIGVFLTPGWALFSPGRDDGFKILLAVVLDTIIFGAMAYGILYLVRKYSGSTKGL